MATSMLCVVVPSGLSASAGASGCTKANEAGRPSTSPALRAARPEGLSGTGVGPALWALSTGDGVTVALVDTGAAPIPWLTGALWSAASRSFVPGQGVTDQAGHGTEMAGIIHEVAPRARLLVLNALGTDGGSDGDVARAIRYGADRGARIINLSAEGAAPDPQIRSAISYAGRHGALVVVAAGNEGINLDSFPSFPAGYSLSNMVVVAATDGVGHLAADSNWGAHGVALGALGTGVPTVSIGGSSIEVSGTSPAAAITSGVAALVLGQNRQLSVGQLRRALLNGVIREQGLLGQTVSGGQLDAARAVAREASSCHAPR